MTGTTEAKAFLHMHGQADIYSMSYGAYDSGRSFARINRASLNSVLRGVYEVLKFYIVLSNGKLLAR